MDRYTHELQAARAGIARALECPWLSQPQQSMLRGARRAVEFVTETLATPVDPRAQQLPVSDRDDV